MSVWAVVVLWVVGVWLVGAVFTAGLLWEREHLLGNAETRAPGWWFAYLVTSLSWLVLLPLWGSSRPALSPAQHVQAAAEAGVQEGLRLAELKMGPGAVMREPYDFTDKELREIPQWLFLDRERMRVTAVDTPASLALCGRIQVGERVWVKSMGLVLTRREMFWFGDCGCRYNFSGFPVVLCRKHRSDVDPQGEPDDDEEGVGR